MTQNTLVDLVYETIDNPEKRSDLVAAFAEVIDAKAAAIAFEDRRLRWASLCVTHGMDRSTIDSYCQYYVGLNPWAGRRPPTVGEVRMSDELLNEAEFRETEFYLGWFQPRGWLHASSIIFHATETERAYLFAVRPPNHPFTKGEIALHKHLAPRLATASRIAMERTALKKPASPYHSMEREVDILKSLGLKTNEAHIALARANDQSVKEIAHQIGRSHETVRSHLKKIHKTLGTPRQADLKRLLADHLRQ
jgi:DNA-binding CsgD family transcriptional regulator